ncbi:unnamed protein product [Hydatigera taeniaeformis]|uniref:PHD-type domain-containing protein n=1 Tax=Hydatigena taeniaeformis TaxID=6205 RepID=A0A0R3WQX9_HYDTA|nr:unnamed protein product [Hydatigera taeniaeformis]
MVIELDCPRPTDNSDLAEAMLCDYCGGDERSNPKRPGGASPEGLLCCSDCTRCAHFSCAQFTPNMITSVRGYRWQCLECKTCWLCGTSENDVSNFVRYWYVVVSYFLCGLREGQMLL